MQYVNLGQASEVIGLYYALAVASSTCVVLTASVPRKSHILRSAFEAEIYLFLSLSSFYFYHPDHFYHFPPLPPAHNMRHVSDPRQCADLKESSVYD